MFREITIDDVSENKETEEVSAALLKRETRCGKIPRQDRDRPVMGRREILATRGIMEMVTGNRTREMAQAEECAINEIAMIGDKCMVRLSPCRGIRFVDVSKTNP